MSTLVPLQSRVVATPKATSAETDEQLLRSWLASLGSPHTKRNFEQAGRRFLAGLPQGLRHATVEDVRASLDLMTHGLAPSSAQQYVLRAKSLMGYAHQLGYTVFNAGTTVKVRHPGALGRHTSVIRAAASTSPPTQGHGAAQV